MAHIVPNSLDFLPELSPIGELETTLAYFCTFPSSLLLACDSLRKPHEGQVTRRRRRSDLMRQASHRSPVVLHEVGVAREIAVSASETSSETPEFTPMDGKSMVENFKKII